MSVAGIGTTRLRKRCQIATSHNGDSLHVALVLTRMTSFERASGHDPSIVELLHSHQDMAFGCTTPPSIIRPDKNLNCVLVEQLSSEFFIKFVVQIHKFHAESFHRRMQLGYIR